MHRGGWDGFALPAWPRGGAGGPRRSLIRLGRENTIQKFQPGNGLPADEAASLSDAQTRGNDSRDKRARLTTSSNLTRGARGVLSAAD
jgi:hypothetical protein